MMKVLAGFFRKSLKYSAMVIALLISASAWAQEKDYITVNGVVKDSKTKERLVFSGIYVPGTSIGTVANSEGQFTLKIPKTLNVQEFGISHLGYHNGIFPVSDGNGRRENVYYLDPASVEIKGVVVRPKDPRTLILQALNRIEDNYSRVPNTLTGFYRETIKQRRDYVSIAEAVTEIYKSPYKFTLESDRIKVIKGRKGDNVKKADTLIVKMQGGPNVSLYLDIVRYPELILGLEEMKHYQYELTDMVSIDNRSNYVISFKPLAKLEYPLYYGKIYVDVESLAITMAEFSMDISDVEKATQAFVRKKPAGLVFEPVSTSYLVTYKKLGDRYYLNYMRSEIKFQADWKKKIFKTSYTLMSEMAITERDTVNAAKIAAKESFKPYAILTDKVNEYFDEDYWGSYNTIEPDESIQSAIAKYNRRFKR